VEGHTSEEEQEERHPLNCLDERPEERLLAETMAQHGVCERRKDIEDDGHTDEDLPTVDIELINRVAKPADDHVVGECEGDSRGDGVVGSDVSEDSHLRSDFDRAPKELPEE